MQSSPLALGTAQLGQNYGIANTTGKPSDYEIKRILEVARQSNIHTIDTAMAYGDSERRLGQAGVGDFKVITKLPPLSQLPATNLSEEIENMVASSLDRLNVSSLYGVLLHSPADLQSDRRWEIIDGLQSILLRGFTNKVGLSAYRPIECLECMHLIDSAILQAPMNAFDRRFSSNPISNFLREMKCEIMARSIFLQGLLLLDKSKIPGKFSKWSSHFGAFHDWCEKNRLSMLEGCLSIFHHYKQVDRLVVGVESSQQLKKISEAWSNLKDTELYQCFCEDEMLLLPFNWQNI